MSDDLRQRAMARVENTTESDPLMHELLVYQAELEIQNEDLRTTQLALETARDEYMDLYNSAPNGYLTLDSNGVIRRANRTMLALLPKPSAGLIGTHMAEIIHAEDRSTFLGRYRAFYAQPDTKLIEVRLAGSNHGELWVRVSGRRHGEQLLIAVNDITTEKRAAEEIRRLLETKETLLQELQHRVKNTMSTVSGMLSLQAGTVSSPEVLQVLAVAQSRINAMVLVYDALSRARDYLSVDMPLYLQELTANLERTLAGSRIALHCQTDGITLPTNTAITVGMIVNEAVTNACKHAFPNGESGSVLVRLHQLDSGGIELTIRDDGTGFDALPESTGLGLGLLNGLASHADARLEIARAEPGTLVRVILRHTDGAVANTNAARSPDGDNTAS